MLWFLRSSIVCGFTVTYNGKTLGLSCMVITHAMQANLFCLLLNVCVCGGGGIHSPQSGTSLFGENISSGLAPVPMTSGEAIIFWINDEAQFVMGEIECVLRRITTDYEQQQLSPTSASKQATRPQPAKHKPVFAGEMEQITPVLGGLSRLNFSKFTSTQASACHCTIFALWEKWKCKGRGQRITNIIYLELELFVWVWGYET